MSATPRIQLALVALLMGSQPARSEVLVETGLEVFERRQSTIEGLHRLSIGWSFGSHLYLAETLYSAALGDAGGAFFWGGELGTHLPLTDRSALDLAVFLGGGGGAAQVPGDGLMMRASAGLALPLGARTELGLGLAWTRIEGSEIDTPSLTLGTRYRSGDRQSPARTPLELRAAAPILRSYNVPDGVVARSGQAQGDVALTGIDLFFALDPTHDLLLGGDGAIAGDGEGFMDVHFGLRRTWPGRDLDLFGEGWIGFGGGGDLDTGAGLMAGLGLGTGVKLTRVINLELGLQGVASPDGSFAALSPYVRAARVFRGEDRAPADRQLRLSTGLSHQRETPSLRRGDLREGGVSMHRFALEIGHDPGLFFSGEAQTTVGGGAGGYAMGLLGIGYRQDLRGPVSLRGEILLGGAGGGGIDTRGGLVGEARVGLEYELAGGPVLEIMAGHLQTVPPGGLASTTLGVGLAIPFGM
ncbi:MAG: hypothetical protein HUJ27_16770 [Rhodobacteraceae bacterium]|nr:hypothetical protein [Paracoccaceae bacterium]